MSARFKTSFAALLEWAFVSTERWNAFSMAHPAEARKLERLFNNPGHYGSSVAGMAPIGPSEMTIGKSVPSERRSAVTMKPGKEASYMAVRVENAASVLTDAAAELRRVARMLDAERGLNRILTLEVNKLRRGLDGN